MKDEPRDCPYCMFIESAEAKTATCIVFDQTGVHNGEPYYTAKIVLGGDRAKCREVIDVVRSYMTTVLGIPEIFTDGVPPLRKPH